MKTIKDSNRAFTLIEMLVVVAIILLLAALITPMVNRGIVRAHRVTCASNLRQIGIAINGYMIDSMGLYPVTHTADFRAGAYGMVELLKDHLPFGPMTPTGVYVDPRHTCPLYRKQNRAWNPNSDGYGSYAYRHDFQGAGYPPRRGDNPTSLAGRRPDSLQGNPQSGRWSIHHWDMSQYGIVWDKGWRETTLATTPHAYHGIPAHFPDFNVLFADGRVSSHGWIHRNGVVPSSAKWNIPLELRTDEYRASP